MNQTNIRDYNNTTYSIAEGAALIKELNNRTSHDENGYNSISELGVKLKQLYESGELQPTENHYGDVNEMLADQANQTEGFDQLVLDASTDPTVTSGEALYRKKATLNSSLDDYIRLSDAELQAISENASYRTFGVKFKTDGAIPNQVLPDHTIFVKYNNLNNLVTDLYFPPEKTFFLRRFETLFSLGFEIYFYLYNKSTFKTHVCKVTGFDDYFNTTQLKVSISETEPNLNGDNINAGDKLEMFISVSENASSVVKKTIALEFPLTGGNTATPNWWFMGGTTSTLYQAGYGNNASVTDANNFSNIAMQTFARIIPFDCKLKNVAVRGFSNTGQGNLDLCVVKSKQTASGSTIQNSLIVARENISIAGQYGSLLEQSFLDSSILDTVIDKDSAIRLVYNNNNQAINILSAVVILVFEEV